MTTSSPADARKPVVSRPELPPAEVVQWLDSTEGQHWREDNISRTSRIGCFAEFKDADVFHVYLNGMEVRAECCSICATPLSIWREFWKENLRRYNVKWNPDDDPAGQ